ncbi:MAG: GerMN domain-containing protein [Mobilitalea sp.]
MKKWITAKYRMIYIIILLVLLTGCKKDNTDNGEIITQPAVTEPTEAATQVPTATPIPTITEGVKPLTILDYYPLKADTESIYEGRGNEYAAYVKYVDYIDAANNKIQTRTSNGGTVTVRVVEIKDGKISVVYIENESYIRANYMEKENTEEVEILLMEPLVVGTKWTLPEEGERYISGTDVAIETPSGSYAALEVTTEKAGSISKDYYAAGVGLVKSVFGEGEEEISSSLSAINQNKPYVQTIDVFFPDADEKIYVENRTLTFHTGEDTVTLLQEILRQKSTESTRLPLISSNTTINSLTLDSDNILNVDFSKEFVTDMNAGSGYEALILQSVVNTLGYYFSSNEVAITLDGNPYESGHILLAKGETLEVSETDVVR